MWNDFLHVIQQQHYLHFSEFSVSSFIQWENYNSNRIFKNICEFQNKLLNITHPVWGWRSSKRACNSRKCFVWESCTGRGCGTVLSNTEDRIAHTWRAVLQSQNAVSAMCHCFHTLNRRKNKGGTGQRTLWFALQMSFVSRQTGIAPYSCYLILREVSYYPTESYVHYAHSLFPLLLLFTSTTSRLLACVFLLPLCRLLEYFPIVNCHWPLLTDILCCI